MKIEVTKNQLTRLVKVTGLSERQILQGMLNKEELELFNIACRFIKVKKYEESRHRERNKVC